MKTRTEIYPHNTRKKFFFLPEGMNRPVVPRHVNKIAASLKKYDNVRKVVCIEIEFIDNEKKTYIVDGQHLFHALIKCEMEIPVVYVQGIKDIRGVIELVATLNNTSKAWTLDDYVDAWASCPETKSQYKSFKSYRETYKLGYSTIAALCNPYKMNRATATLKDGSLKINNKPLTETLLENVNDMFKIVDKGYMMEVRVLVEGYTAFYLNHMKNYNHTKFINVFRSHKSMVNQYMHNTSTCTAFLTEIYKGGKIDKVVTLQRAGSPKALPNSIKVSKA